MALALLIALKTSLIGVGSAALAWLAAVIGIATKKRLRREELEQVRHDAKVKHLKETLPAKLRAPRKARNDRRKLKGKEQLFLPAHEEELDMTPLQRDIADVARRVIESMYKAGDKLDAAEIHQAVVATFKNHHVDADTSRRLRLHIERWIAKVQGAP